MVKKGGPFGPPKRRVRMSSLPIAVQAVATGEWQYIAPTTNSGLSKTADTSYTHIAIASASSVDVMYTHIQYKLWLFSSATRMPISVAVVKCLSSDAVQDIGNSTTLELLKKDGKLFFYDFWVQPAYAAAGGSLGRTAPPLKFEWKNVQLKDGEELRIVYRPKVSVTDFWYAAVGGWRSVNI